MRRDSLPLKYIILLVLLFILPLVFDKPDGQLEMIWLIYMLPVLITTYLLGLSGGLITAAFSTFIHAGWELREHFFYHSTYNHQNFGAMILLDVTLFAMAVSLGMLAEKIKGEKESIATELVEVNRTLQSSQDIFTKAFSANPVPMLINRLDDAKIVEANRSFEALMGYTREEVIGHTSDALNITLNMRTRLNLYERIQRDGSLRNCEANYVTKSGEVRTGLFSFELVTLDGEPHILGACNDVTDLKRIQAEMARLDRLNLIGVMAAGLGHEIRNPLTTVRGFLQLLGKDEKFATAREYFELMISEMDQMNAIITEFLSIAKTRNTDLEMLNLNQIIKNLQPLVTADALSKEKTIILNLQVLPDIEVNEKEIRQLILNLVRNGLEAMSGNGELSISTFCENDQVVLAVQDQGEGISSETMSKLGTPFYTTKDTGTGLGLAVCYGIVKRHNATIKVESGPKGTTFYVKFRLPPQLAIA